MKDLVDEEGENIAVRFFLMFYSGNKTPTYGAMRNNMRLAGYDNLWPSFVTDAADNEHMAKAGAQLWLRFLFGLEQEVK